MKRLCLPVLLLCCLLLSACGDRSEEERYAEFAQSVAEADTLSFEAGLRAEYEDRTLEFRLRCERDGEGCTVSVLAPETMAGIRARLTEGSSTLAYEGLVIDTGDLDAYGLTPVNALPRLLETMAGGHLESCWTEAGQDAFQLIADDHLSATVYFEPETMTPQEAELLSDGHLRVACQIEGWELSAPGEQRE